MGFHQLPMMWHHCLFAELTKAVESRLILSETTVVPAFNGHFCIQAKVSLYAEGQACWSGGLK